MYSVKNEELKSGQGFKKKIEFEALLDKTYWWAIFDIQRSTTRDFRQI